MTPDQVLNEFRKAGALLKGHFVLSSGLHSDVFLSSRECLDAIRAAGGKPMAAACLIDRSGGKAKVGVKLIALATLKFPTWEADRLPAHLRDTPGVKPGSRGLA